MSHFDLLLFDSGEERTQDAPRLNLLYIKALSSA